MKKLLFFLLGIALSMNVFGTAQYPDKIIYNGKEYMLYSNPLEAYYEKYPEKRINRFNDSIVSSTALWRGYVATFEIKDGMLCLKDIEVEVWDKTKKIHSHSYDTKWISVKNALFPDDPNMKIDWFSGLLVIPHGRMKNYVHMGYGSTYRRYILLELEDGNLIKEMRFNYKEYERFKERQFQAFKQTEEYKKILDDLMKEQEMSEEFLDSFLRNFVVQYTSKILVD